MNQAEIMTVAITAALFYGGNLSRTRQVLMWNGYIKNMLSESRLNRQLHKIDFSLWELIFRTINLSFKHRNHSQEYIVDSMPIEVCANYRSYRCKLLKGKEFIGFCKAKKKFYYGLKLHALVTAEGLPIEFLITPASIADITAFKMMTLDVNPGSTIYADKAYTDYGLEQELLEIEAIYLVADRKANSKKQHSGCLRYIQSKIRKRIETFFSQLIRLFPRKIDAVTCKGFLMKILIFISAFAFQKVEDAALA
jgi:IS5 family transposase